jgi:hypothetical protein
MGFGSAFKKAWSTASDVARQTAAAVAADVNAAKAYAIGGARAVARTAHDAGVTAKDAVVAGGAAAKNAAIKAGVAVKKAAVSAGSAAKDAVVGAKNAVIQGAKKVGSAVTAARDRAHKVTSRMVGDAYKKAHAVFGRQPVGQPIQRCPQLLGEKLERLAARRDYINAGKARAKFKPEPERSRIRQAAARLESNNIAVERARLAYDVYKDPENKDPSPPVGWVRVQDHPELMQKLRIDSKKLKDLLEPPNLGMRAELYMSKFEGRDSFVIAYKGTTGAEDWMHNGLQNAGFGSAYYNKATELAKAVKKTLGDKVNLEVTGHSLGGGMASAAAIKAGLNATTFNSAGLHPNTAMYSNSQPGKRIDAYHVERELLTTLQDPDLNRLALAAGTAAGSPVAAGLLLLNQPLLHDAVGTMHTLPAIDEKDESGQGYSRPVNDINPAASFNRHAATAVIDGIEQQKADDIHLLKSL